MTNDIIHDSVVVLKGRKVVGGRAEGEALVTRDRVSGWGGIDPRTGTNCVASVLPERCWCFRAPRAAAAGRTSST